MKINKKSYKTKKNKSKKIKKTYKKMKGASLGDKYISRVSKLNNITYEILLEKILNSPNSLRWTLKKKPLQTRL